ncbi:MAG: hypothetical protein IKD10_03360 [Lentisphaeria bacterium]|nr:hypothetical protein [Lentisphaeria bacterium]
MENYTVITMLTAGTVFFAALAFFLWRSNKEHLPEAETLLRNKGFGMILSAAALCWCVPQVQAVAWAWLANYAWIIAAAALLLCIKYLDNLASRGFAGLLIMGAYSFLDMSFDCKLNMNISGALPAWIWGAVGIVIAAKPCYLRDYLRLGAEKPFFRYLAAALSGITVLFLIATVIIYLKVQG